MRLIRILISAVRSRAYFHWSPQYLHNRFKLYLYEITHPDYPWLTQQANEFLSNWIRKIYVGFEWGSGRSTVWLAKRCKHLTSVEHNLLWYEKVAKRLSDHNLTNVDLVFAKDKTSYVGTIEKFKDFSLDFVLVDGKYRDECTLRALRKIKPGGLLIIDNINRYLPSTSKSPGSRTWQDGLASPSWKTIFKILKEWRCFWTSNGVTDTAIYIKPRQS